MTTTRFSVVVGLVLGAVWVFGGFWAMILVAVVATIAFWVGRLLEGRLDLNEIVGRLQGRR
ncbi:DUF2273 domain-containing protein [Paeniglutamicibacter sp. Y32M11]|uniref:DUF2273 domain-containing protein n=1 Tax=Paeniglutamicibacter sp. Y32M11 TaxID=2853258 RepID=UPI001047BB49|nr:DUF2273 domain-containing protein [Paeniglutamicibacter sp. Y32M11]QXQ09760.1 DUF2273 domain-containing protein [Paeniglutamicibacter sp. Y32M11]